MSDAYGNIIPQRFVPPTRATKYEQQVIVNWLQVEVPHKPMPQLDTLKGWRNIEVFWFIKNGPDWTARCFQ